ncbi:glycosyl transferase family 2, partial [Paenibacillus darwinianus]
MRKLAGGARRTKRRTPPRNRRPEIRGRFADGHAAGYRDGLQTGMAAYGTVYEGTSIVIPTCNHVEYLKNCIDSIIDNTDLPYEIIVVDNGSTDATAAYLKSLRGRVRYRLLETNLGFAAAVNHGLMMAKGRTIVLLNNDVLVTEHWLENMMRCLYSDERIGMVGPVTNYISGEQLMKTNYSSTREMYAFARRHNLPDPAKWRETNRLTGFCLLFRRELWERTGYWDEGFQNGNFEDDDYCVRVRMQGYSLMIAGDAFIHHFGSVTIKAFGKSYRQINERNGQYYMDKWGDPHGMVHRARANGLPHLYAQKDFYPRFIAVKGIGDTVFWLDGGERRPIHGDSGGLPVVQLTQIDIGRWPIGPVIAAEEAEAAWHADRAAVDMQGGVLAALPEGALYYLESGVRRFVATMEAASAWKLTA